VTSGRAVRVGFIGAAHAHAAIDARNLRSLGAELVGVVDHDDPVRLSELTDGVGVEALADIAALAARAPDVVVVTPRTRRVPQIVATLLAELDERSRVFVNKVAAATQPQFAALDAVAASRGASRFGTGSVLTFAPAVRSLAARIAGRDVLALTVMVHHDAAAFRTPARAWQDDPADGGGTLLSVGTHAWQLVDALLPGATLTSATGTVRDAVAAVHRSEDVGVISGVLAHGGGARTSGIPVQVTVSGLPGPDLYSVEVLTDGGLDGARLTDRDAGAELGFIELAEALLAATVEGRALLPWSSSRAVVANTIAAAAAARV